MPQFSRKFINDNIYGGIGFSELEFRIINTNTFQRLRRIKQQGLTSLIFPSSEHTRFSHSLGVLYVMGKMTDHLLKSGYLTDVKDQEKLRLAALLHDIGHYPHSHLTEAVYIKIGKKAAVRDQAPLVEKIKDVKESPLTKFSQKPRRNLAHHEEMGVEVLKRRRDIRELLKGAGYDVEEIGSIINGKTPSQLFHQLMHSSLDCDRLDYLLRDSAAAGVTYGMIDLDYLIRLLCVADHNQVYGDRKVVEKVLAVSHKGIRVLEHYLMARYFSYSQITMHKTTTAFETLAKALILELANQGEIYPTYEDVLEIMDKDDFLKFDDSYLWDRLHKSKTCEEGLYNLYKKTLLERKRIKVLIDMKYIGDKDENPDPKTDYGKVREKVRFDFDFFANRVGIPVENLGYVEQKLSVDVSWSEIEKDEKDYVEAPKIKKPSEVEFLVHNDSSLIKELCNRELKILRVFYIDPFPKDNVRSAKHLSDALEKIKEDLQLQGL